MFDYAKRTAEAIVIVWMHTGAPMTGHLRSTIDCKVFTSAYFNFLPLSQSFHVARGSITNIVRDDNAVCGHVLAT